MKSVRWTLAVLSALALVSCIVIPGRTRKRFPSPPTAPEELPDPPPTVPETSPPPPAPGPKPPGSFSEAMNRVGLLRDRIEELAGQDRLFEIPGTAGRLEAAAQHFFTLFEREYLRGILDDIRLRAQELEEVADLLERRGADESSENLKKLNAEILRIHETLARYEPLADDYEVKNVPPGAPRTFARALVRTKGVHHSIAEKIERSMQFEIPEVASHLKMVAQNLRRLAINNISSPAKTAAQEAMSRIQEAALRIRVASQRDNRTRVLKELETLNASYNALQILWDKFRPIAAPPPPNQDVAAPEPAPE